MGFARCKDSVYELEYKYFIIVIHIIVYYVLLVLLAIVVGHYTLNKYKLFVGDDTYEGYILVISLLTVYYWLVMGKRKFIIRLKIRKRTDKYEVTIDYVKYLFFRGNMIFDIAQKEGTSNGYECIRFDCEEGIILLPYNIKLTFYNKKHCYEVKKQIESKC